jgi:hypothetical protein
MRMILKVSEVILRKQTFQSWKYSVVVEIVDSIHLARAVIYLALELAEALIRQGQDVLLGPGQGLLGELRINPR